MEQLRNFQKKFIRAATRPDVDTAVFSIPRANGKSSLAGHLISRVLDPYDVLFRAGTESVLCAASIEQARIVYRFARSVLEPSGEYRFIDSATRAGITHRDTNTRLRVIGSNGKTAMGLVNTPWAICDEPGAWEVNGGQLLHDAIQTAQGKPGSPLKAVYIGTLAPSTSGWWHELVEGGSRDSTYVQVLRADPAKWDKWPEIRRCNPLTAISPRFRKKLIEERDAARADPRLKARFMSYRMNVPTADESQVLLTVDDWKRVEARPVPERDGRPIVGVDIGAGRAWSAAVAMWHNGRTEAIAFAPGIPSIAEQEKRDRVGKGTYARLIEEGRLLVAEELLVQPPEDLIAFILSEWGRPRFIICDRFKLSELKDKARGIQLVPRVAYWSEASEDIRALRRMAANGPLSCEVSSRNLIAASLSVATVRNDDSGNVRLAKRGTHNTARDDVAAALVLGAGALKRTPDRPRARYRGFA